MEANTSCLAAVLSRTLETLPADAIVLALLTHAIVNAHKIDYDLVVPHTRRHLFEFRVLVADHNRLGVLEDAVNAIHHEAGNMRDPVQKEIFVSLLGKTSCRNCTY